MFSNGFIYLRFNVVHKVVKGKRIDLLFQETEVNTERRCCAIIKLTKILEY